MTNATSNILQLRDDRGLLPSYAFPGAYPLYYLDGENNDLCPDCANENDNYTSPITAYGVNYEDSELYCDQCGKRIESAYGEN